MNLVSRMTPADLSLAELNRFQLIERICSVLSLLGCLFIAVTFLGSNAFHKPINRLVFFASVGNIFTNVATIISRAAITNSEGGLCQFQAFLIQMFMPADAYWTLAMAINVYLTFYWKYDAGALRKLEKYYIIFCYGIPFIPALAYLWVQTPAKGKMYGNATLWCWVATPWDVVRIASFYGPVWIVILLTTGIYLRAGREIYLKRKHLRNLSAPVSDRVPILADPFQSVKTTEVFVTSESIESPVNAINLREFSRQGLPVHYPPPRPATDYRKHNYTVTVSSSHPILPSPKRYSYNQEPPPRPSERRFSAPTAQFSAHRPASSRANFLPTRRYAATEANNAAMGYTKVAVLFFIAMMVTWIPSSANRVYSVVHPGKISLGLEYASAFVLPLQGFWNALIYTTTSLPACKQVWIEICGQERRGLSRAVFGNKGHQSQQSRKQYVEAESMTDLASQPDAKESSSL